MKRIFIFLLSIILNCGSFTMFSQPAQPVSYSSLEIIDGIPTGYTNVITLLWDDPVTVNVTRSKRLSTGGDEVGSIDLASLDTNRDGDDIVLSYEDNIWIIPFDENANIAQLAANLRFSCPCSTVESCEAVRTPAPFDYGPPWYHCEKDECTGFCTEKWNTSGNPYGNILILRAVTCNFE